MKLGLIGEKLGHSQSPAIHTKLFQLLGIQGSYDLIEMNRRDVPNELIRLKREGYVGLNVTIPYKIEVMPFLADIAHEAQVIGAVNTIYMTAEGDFGYNTDYSGFGRSLDHAGIAVQDKECVVLGTGGAARAIVKCLYDKGARTITIASRNPQEKSEFAAFAKTLHGRMVSYEELAAQKDGDVLVNCTPVGMYPNIDASPVSKTIAAMYPAVVDLIYNPKTTRILQYAQQQGAKTLNGMYMLVAQAIGSEEIWQKQHIDNAVIEEIAKEMEKQYE